MMTLKKRFLTLSLCALATPVFLAACDEAADPDGSGGGDGAEGGASSGGSSSGGNASGGSGSGGRASGGSVGAGGTATGGEGGETNLGGQGGMGGAGESPIPDHNYLTNASFEEGEPGDTVAAIPGWSETHDGNASTIENGQSRSGDRRLNHWEAWVQEGDWYQVETWQTVTGLPNGTYTFSVWVRRSEWFTEQYLFARGYGDEVQLEVDTIEGFSETEYVQVQLTDIPVTSGQVTVGIYSAAPGNIWAHFDDASLTGE